jgi:hypothetical protein
MALFTADIKQAFLYSPLAKGEMVYVIPPFELGFPPGSIWKLYRALYGLKVGPHLFHQFRVFAEWISAYSFVQINNEGTLFMLQRGHTQLLLGVFVEDLIIAANDMNLYNTFAKDQKARFQLSSEGSISNFLGVSIHQDLTSGTIKVDQAAYIESTSQQFGFSNSTTLVYPLARQWSPINTSANTTVLRSTIPNGHFRAVVGSLLPLAGVLQAADMWGGMTGGGRTGAARRRVRRWVVAEGECGGWLA